MRSARRLVVLTALVCLVGGGLVTAGLARGSDEATSDRERSSALLDNATVVRRCLPQLTRAVEPAEFSEPTDPLSPRTVQVAKPLVEHRVGDLVSFVGSRTYKGGREWPRLARLCRVPADDPRGAPGSDPLPRSAVVPGEGRPTRNAQLCNEAPDGSTVVGDQTFNETQVAVPDVRRWPQHAQVWRGRHGVVLRTDPDNGTVALCDFGTIGPAVKWVADTAPRTAPHLVNYSNGDRASGEPDRYWVAGVVPSYGDQRRIPARTVVVRPPGQPEQRCAITGVDAAGGRLGYYACVIEFPAEQATMGDLHTEVRVLDAQGRALWHGRWLVGIEGH